MPPTIARDPIHNVINGQIKHEIRVLLEARCFTGAIKLVFSGIDTMAYLGMPREKQSVERSDFVAWVDRYIRFPCKEQLTGLDMYGARCAMLHQHGTESGLSRDGKCRQVAYTDRMIPEVRYDATIDTGLVMVSATALIEAFFRAVEEYIVHIYADPKRAALADERFAGIVHSLPADDAPQAPA